MHFDSRLWLFTQGFRWRIFLSFLVGVFAVGVGVARLASLGWLLSRIIGGAGISELLLPIVVIALLMLSRGALEYSRNIIAHQTAAGIQLVLRRLLFDKLMMLGPGYVTQQRSGELALTLVDGIEQLETYFGRYLPQLMVSAVTPIIIFGFVSFIDLPVSIVLLTASIVALFAPALWHRFDTRRSLEREQAYGEFAAEFLDSVQGLSTLKSFGQSSSKADLLTRKARDLFRTTMWVLATNSLARGITDTSIALGAAIALVFGAHRVAAGTMELSALLIILLLGVEIFRPLRELRSVLHQGMVGRSAAIGVYRIFDANPEVQENSKDSNPADLKPSIALKDVVFRYPGKREIVHQDLTFNVEPGERIGIVGPSGCGKSTIVRALQRFYDPISGTVSIGGIDIRNLSLDRIRKQISVVYQDTFLFHGTVRENLHMGRPGASEAELNSATQAANIYDFIMELPQGYDTVIGERGIKLSGGQRQRIAIARALLRDTPILILDEALSSVDAENEAIILEALDRLMVGRTTLVFAHRLSSVINCDRILVLSGGKIVEQGSHSDLLKNGQIYRDLMAEQVQMPETSNLPIKAIATLPGGQPPEHPQPHDYQIQPTEGIIRAEGLTWSEAFFVLMKHILPWRGRVAMVFGFGIVRVLTFIGVGVFSALIVLALKNGYSFQPSVLGLFIVASITGALHWSESWIAHDMAFRLLAELRISVFRKIDELAPAYLTRRRTGDLMAIATQDIEMIEYFFAHTVAPAFVSILIPGIVLIILGIQNIWLAMAIAPFLIAVALSPFLMRSRVDQLGSKAKEAAGELSAHAIDSIQGIAEILAFQNEAHRSDNLNRIGATHISLRLPFYKQLTFQEALLETLTGLGALTVVVIGGLIVQSNGLDAGLLPLLTILAMAAFLPISEIAEIGRQLADTLGATRRFYALENEPVPVTDGPGVLLQKEDPSLSLRQVNFHYPGYQATVLSEIACDISAGKTVAIVGPSGSGKTTLAHLLMRFWDPTSGKITLGGADLREFQLEQLRQQMALVAQDTYLFNDTLGANITIARPNATRAELNQALEFSALENLVTSLPKGLQTNVGERGTSLSGGQRQRVAIARAFLKDAPILILDEATSHLDALSEQSVHQALNQLQVNRTTIVIAHRLSTIREADIILVLDKGRLVQAGTHNELNSRDGLYAALIGHQISAGSLLKNR